MDKCFIYLISTLSFLSSVLIFQPAYAAVKISQASGNWSNIATWGGSAVPGNNDEVIISSGTVVNLNTALPVSSALLSLAIESGASLVVSVNTSTLRVRNSIVNNGVLNLWVSQNLQADIILYNNSIWSGTGIWNLSTVNIQNFALEVPAGMTLGLNGSLTATAGGSFNKLNKYPNITLNLTGSANSTIASAAGDFFYAHVVVNKTSGTLSFSPSLTENQISLSGDITLVNANDQLVINDNNILAISGSVTGLGSISAGGITASLIISNVTGAQINPLRVASGIALKKFTLNRTAGVVFQSGFTVRDELALNNLSVAVLSPQTLVLGANGASAAPGIFSGNGYLVGSASSSVSIRGNAAYPTILRFRQSVPADYTLSNLTIDKLSGACGLEDGSNLTITGTLDVLDYNTFQIGSGTLTLNSVPHFFDSGSLQGSSQSNLVLAGNGTTSYSIRFNQNTEDSYLLKTYVQSRRATVTLDSKLKIGERLSLTGTAAKLASNGNLVMLSTETTASAIAPLVNGCDIIGEVNVQVYLSGNGNDLSFRGNRSLSSPINDNLVPTGSKRSLEQLKDYMIITGPGGVLNGFDQGGVSQPFAQTVNFYNEPASAGQPSFLPLANLATSLGSGSGFFAFFRGKQMGTYALNAAKLNSPYMPPEATTVVYKGIINKADVKVNLSNSTNPGDVYNGYNLIGNPYPSAIDWNKVSRSPTVSDEVIVIKPNGSQATYFSGISNNDGSQYIQTGQGFYVRTTANNSSITFKEDCKTENLPARLLSVPESNSLFATEKVKKPVERKPDYNTMKISLEDHVNRDETTLVFKSNDWPTRHLQNVAYFSGSTVNLYSLSVENERFAVNFIADTIGFEEIKLGVNARSSGLIKLNFTKLPVLENGAGIFLKDAMFPGKLIRLDRPISYPFLIDRNTPDTFGNKRFSISISRHNLEAAGNKTIITHATPRITVYPNPVFDRFSVNLKPEPGEKIDLLILDMKGYKVERLSFENNGQLSADLTGMPAGIYLAEARSNQTGKLIARTLIFKN